MEAMSNFRISFLCIFLILGVSIRTEGRNIVFNAEWGADALIFQHYSYNIIDNSGSRFDDAGSNLTYHANGSLLFGAGINAGRFSRIALEAGFAGIADNRRMFPLSMRYGFYPSGTDSDGIYCFAEGGVLYDPKGVGNIGYIGRLGPGYHIHLSQNTALNFNINARLSYSHPEVINPDGGGFVSKENIRNTASVCASIGVSLSLDF